MILADGDCKTKMKQGQKCSLYLFVLNSQTSFRKIPLFEFHCDVTYGCCNHIFFFQTGPFLLKSPPLSTFNQQLWLIAHIVTDNSEGMYVDVCFKFNSIYFLDMQLYISSYYN